MKVVAISLFVAVMAGLLSVWAAAPHSSAAQTGDYDSDDDGLIEISALEQLNAVRWDLDGNGEADDQANQDAYAAVFPNGEVGMGCPDSGCIGYELARDLDFDDAGSYASGAVNTKWTEGAGWLPIGLVDNAFRATFDGNDLTIANLYIKRSGLTDPGAVGLFGSASGYINEISLLGIEVSGNDYVGGLVGESTGTISESYITGNVSGDAYVGGLVGNNYGGISDSYNTGKVTGNRHIGGLAGRNRGEMNRSYNIGSVSGDRDVGGLVGRNDGTILSSYATGDVSGWSTIGGLSGSNYATIRTSYAKGSVSGSRYTTGGLVGQSSGDNAIIASSYATGDVSGNEAVGGLVGENRIESLILASYSTGSVSGESLVSGLIGINHLNAIVSDSYWDTQTSGLSDGMEGKTTAELQAPTGYTGIYAGWLLDFDNADGDFDDTTGVDDFWDFGTSGQYPALKADMDGDGVATWEEFGDQRGQSPTPAPSPTPTVTPPSPTPVPPGPTPVIGADLELTMLAANYFGIPFYYIIVENNGPSDATEVVLRDSIPEGVSPMLSIPVSGTCSGDKTVVCELGGLAVGSRNLVMIIARLDASFSQNVPVNSASVSAAEPDPYPTNNVASR